jgi:putative aminopeptidase FrvX
MNEQTLELFSILTEMPAASGFETDLRRFVRSQLEPVSDEIVQDRLGGIFGIKKGAEGGPRIMVAGHLDEVGFITTAITENGMIKFQALGSWSNQVLLAQRMQIITKNGPVVGVIGSVPPHLLDEASRNKPVEISAMYIDIGADDRQHAESLGIRPGLQAVPVCPFTRLAGGKKIMAKAWDNRFGVGLAIELLQTLQGESLPNTLAAGATVQEEVGLRGAETAANLIRPDLAFVLDISPANDMTGDNNAFGQLGKGTLLRIIDRSMVTNPAMVEYIRDTAETHRVPYQYFLSQGGTDAGRVHLNGNGVPTGVIGICGRYIHSAASIIHIDDYAAAKELLIQLVRGTDKSVYESIIGD